MAGDVDRPEVRWYLPATPNARRGVETFAMPDLGTRFDCFQCSAKFYDLGRPEPICPKCGANQKDAKRQEAPVEPPPSRRRRKEEPVRATEDDDSDELTNDDGENFGDEELVTPEGGDEEEDDDLDEGDDD